MQPTSPLVFTVDQAPTEDWNRAENIAIVENQGFDDDGNNPSAEENVPTNGAPVANNAGLYPSQRRGWNGFSQRRINTSHDIKPNSHFGWTPLGKTWVDMFSSSVPCSVVTGRADPSDVSCAAIGELIR